MVQVATDVTHIPVAEPVERRWGRHRAILRFLIADKIGLAGYIIFGFFVLLAVFGPILMPSDKVDVTAIYAPPSWDHPSGPTPPATMSSSRSCVAPAASSRWAP